MKRIFTYAALAIATLSASATDYTGQLKVNVDGMVLPEAETTVTINKNENQTYALELNNLILTMGGAPAGIGNIVLNEVRAHEESGVTTLVINDNITITERVTPSSTDNNGCTATWCDLQFTTRPRPRRKYHVRYECAGGTLWGTTHFANYGGYRSVITLKS